MLTPKGTSHVYPQQIVFMDSKSFSHRILTLFIMIVNQISSSCLAAPHLPLLRDMAVSGLRLIVAQKWKQRNFAVFLIVVSIW